MEYKQIVARSLKKAASVIALAAATTFVSGALQPAAAEGIYGGGGNFFGLVFRALADCYHGKTPAGVAVTTPACNTVGRPKLNVEALYAAVNSAAGRRAIITNDPKQLLPGSVGPFSLPAAIPLYKDTTGFLPNVYPYTRLDFGAGDDALQRNLTIAPLTTVQPFTGHVPAPPWTALPVPPATPITAVLGAARTYNLARFGRPINVPAAQLGVGVVVNAPRTSIAPWRISTQGSAVMHLSQPQLCAIFAGAVTNWNDSTTQIAYRDNLNVLKQELFRAGNAPSGLSYTTVSRPITIVYRGDNSGQTQIFSNFLSDVCPFFDNGVNNYQKIFAPTAADITAGYKRQPSGVFPDLIANIVKAFPSRAATTASWIPLLSNTAIAAAVSNNTANPAFSGRFSYLGTSFIQPYSKLANAPFAAAIQDEAQRLAGVYRPSATTPFIFPTPASVNLAWGPGAIPASDPGILPPTTAAASLYSNWDIYEQKHIVFGGQSKSILTTPTRAGAYPITGTFFYYLYSCYADPTGARVTAITDFLSWIYGGSVPTLPAGTPATSTRNAPKFDSNVRTVLNSQGWGPVPASFATSILNNFVTNAPGARPLAIQSFRTGGVPQVNGCTGVTAGGAL